MQMVTGRAHPLCLEHVLRKFTPTRPTVDLRRGVLLEMVVREATGDAALCRTGDAVVYVLVVGACEGRSLG